MTTPHNATWGLVLIDCRTRSHADRHIVFDTWNAHPLAMIEKRAAGYCIRWYRDCDTYEAQPYASDCGFDTLQDAWRDILRIQEGEAAQGA